MQNKRIIPCLDIKDGRTVKGINFLEVKDAGNPMKLAKKYCADGADELVLLDITATVEKRKTLLRLVKEIAQEITIPFTVGGGINSLDVACEVLQAGANKVSVNSSAVHRPELIREIAQKFGKQSVVVAIDTKFENNQWKVLTHGGSTMTTLNIIDWAKEIETLGAGEILLTSMNKDGTKNGFSLDITKQVAEAVNLPVIASGGAGTLKHFKEVFEKTKATGALAASVFHYEEIAIPTLKKYLT
ncbi:MAG TPA: imidazole glycerol phosphate synthase subunit HisF [Candidatus Sphingobacterium stercoripullorum]|nr:imidazole glycerol phosphate synthase subunit HisF [Candidatus Sphingobacterium stercoripullorum]